MPNCLGTAPWDHRPLVTVLVGAGGEPLGEPEGIIACDPSSVPKRVTPNSVRLTFWVLSLDSVYEYERALSANTHGTLLRPNTRSVSGAGQGVPHPCLSDPPKARPMGTAASALLGAVVGPTAALLGCWVPGVRGHLRRVRGRRTWGDVQRRRLTPARGGRWQQVSLDGAPAAWSRSSRRPSVPGGIEPGGLVGP